MFPRIPQRPLRDLIYEKLQYNALLATLFDPENETSTLVRKSEIAVEQGTDIMLIGGSSHVSPVRFFEAMAEIKTVAPNIPLVIYNANFEMTSDVADGMLYGSVLNSNDMHYVINNCIGASPLLTKRTEPLATAFLIFEPGMTVGYMLNCHLLPQNNVKIAVAYSLTAEHLGYSFIYLEAGSRAPNPISPSIIRAVRKSVQIPLIVGGGIVSAQQAKETVEAGADIIVIGTRFENVEDISDIVHAIHTTKRFLPQEQRKSIR